MSQPIHLRLKGQYATISEPGCLVQGIITRVHPNGEVTIECNGKLLTGKPN